MMMAVHDTNIRIQVLNCLRRPISINAATELTGIVIINLLLCSATQCHMLCWFMHWFNTICYDCP